MSRIRRPYRIALLVVLVVLAAGLPRLMPAEPPALGADEAKAAAYARRQAYSTGWENALEKLAILRVSTRRVFTGGAWPAEPGVPGALEAVVRAYTFFGLPYSQITLNERGGHVDWRSPTPLLAGAVLAAAALWACGPILSRRRPQALRRSARLSAAFRTRPGRTSRALSPAGASRPDRCSWSPRP